MIKGLHPTSFKMHSSATSVIIRAFILILILILHVHLFSALHCRKTTDEL